MNKEFVENSLQTVVQVAIAALDSHRHAKPKSSKRMSNSEYRERTKSLQRHEISSNAGDWKSS